MRIELLSQHENDADLYRLPSPEEIEQFQCDHSAMHALTHLGKAVTFPFQKVWGELTVGNLYQFGGVLH